MIRNSRRRTKSSSISRSRSKIITVAEAGAVVEA